MYPLTKHLPRKPHKQVVNLLSGESSSSSAKAASAKPTSAPTPASGSGVDTGAPASTSGDGATSGALPYWRPCLHTQLLVDFTTHNPNGMMPHVAPLIVAHAPSRRYLPLGLVSDFWLMDHQLVELNSSVTSVPLVISFSPGSMWKWTLQHQMSMSWEMQETLGTSSAGEKDMIKSVLLETNPILLAITMIVSTLHMVFDTLAFKNDISFWRNTKTLEGLSVRSIAVGVFVQTVIVLYLFDNDTSWMVLMSSVVGLAIEIWKLRKAVSVSVEWTPAGWPRLRWDDKDEAYSTSHTKEYDDIATGHMLYILYPLVVGYAVYSLVYQEHRSWYTRLYTA
ncbi:MAG: hypothetical protein EOO65_05900 [Methanosarcinales archaeon]|nr:MAG: hypothetical protein EOO65_05900 [Methanosarcinales archaeon]